MGRRTERAGVPLAKIEEIKRAFGPEATEQAIAHIEKQRADPFGVRDASWMPVRHDPVVYYMRMDRLVKIGVTTNIKARVDTIMPQGVLAVEPGGREKEQRRHRQFSEFHSHLEWYWLRPSVWEHIISIRDQLERAHGFTTERWLRRCGLTRAASPDLLDQREDLGFT